MKANISRNAKCARLIENDVLPCGKFFQTRFRITRSTECHITCNFSPAKRSERENFLWIHLEREALNRHWFPRRAFYVGWIISCWGREWVESSSHWMVVFCITRFKIILFNDYLPTNIRIFPLMFKCQHEKRMRRI